MSNLQHVTSQGMRITVAVPAGRDRLTDIEAEEILTWLKSILEPPKSLVAPQLEIQTDIKTETKEFVVRVRPLKTTLTEYWKIKEAERARNDEQREKELARYQAEQRAKKKDVPRPVPVHVTVTKPKQTRTVKVKVRYKKKA
jgi:hypothetical protein